MTEHNYTPEGLDRAQQQEDRIEELREDHRVCEMGTPTIVCFGELTHGAGLAANLWFCERHRSFGMAMTNADERYTKDLEDMLERIVGAFTSTESYIYIGPTNYQGAVDAELLLTEARALLERTGYDL